MRGSGGSLAGDAEWTVLFSGDKSSGHASISAQTPLCSLVCRYCSTAATITTVRGGDLLSPFFYLTKSRNYPLTNLDLPNYYSSTLTFYHHYFLHTGLFISFLALLFFF